MYRISSTNSFLNGRQFDSLAAAKAFADKHGKSCVCDVIALVDRETFRAVYTGKGHSAVVPGTYRKGV